MSSLLETPTENPVGRGKERFTIRHLFADKQCSPTMDFLSTTSAGMLVSSEG